MDIELNIDSKLCYIDLPCTKEYQIVFGNWILWMQADIDKDGPFANRNSGEMKDFANIVHDYCMKDDVVTSGWLYALHKSTKFHPEDDIRRNLLSKPV